MRKHSDKTIDIKSEPRRPEFMFKHFSFFKVLLRLANFEAIVAIEKRFLIKLLTSLKRTKCKNDKSLYHTIVIYLSLICYLRISTYLWSISFKGV